MISNILAFSYFSIEPFYFTLAGFPGDSDGKESACHEGDLGLIPGLRRSLGEGNGNPLQYSCLENPLGRGAWRATVHGIKDSDTTERLTRWCIRRLLPPQRSPPSAWRCSAQKTQKNQMWPSDGTATQHSYALREPQSSAVFSARTHAQALQLHLTLCDPMDCSLLSSSVRGILQARILEWVAISSPRGSSQTKDLTHISCPSCIAGSFSYTKAEQP